MRFLSFFGPLPVNFAVGKPERVAHDDHGAVSEWVADLVAAASHHSDDSRSLNTFATVSGAITASMRFGKPSTSITHRLPS